MTPEQRAAMEQAREVLNYANSLIDGYYQPVESIGEAIAALDSVLEQPAQPYKGIADHTYQATNGRVRIDPITGDVGIGTPSEQPARAVAEPHKWVGLTDQEAQWLYDNCRTPANLIDMVEAKLREKNA